MPLPFNARALALRASLLATATLTTLMLTAASTALNQSATPEPGLRSGHSHAMTTVQLDIHGDPYRPWPTAQPTTTPVPGRLPDLMTEVPEEIYIEYDEMGRKLLRFETRVMNTGEGALELRGSLSDDGERAFATQIIEQNDGSTREYPAGALSFSEQHHHWHLDHFALFELRPISPAGNEEEPVAAQNKITFCLLDEQRIDPESPDEAEEPRFLDCDWQNQGLSQGWSETYVAALPEQWIDITGLPDGLYRLHVTLDPDNLLIESDQDNNGIHLDIELDGDRVTVVSDDATPTPTRMPN